jgi:hypothetical protein
MHSPSSSRLAERLRASALAALLVATGAGAAAAPTVLVSRDGDGLGVEAQGAPLSEVLDAIGRELGVQVEYEGGPPQNPVTLKLVGRTPAEAVLALLDGTGVSYAIQLDTTGQGVSRLLIQTAAAGVRSRPAPRRPTRSASPIPTPPPIPEFAEPFDPAQAIEEADEEDPEEEPPPPLPPTQQPRQSPFRTGRPSPSPLLFPNPLTSPAPTPTPPPQR